MKKDSTRQLLMVGLLLLALLMPWWLYQNTATLGMIGSIILGAMFPLLFLRATWRKSRNWSGITALFMIPYAVLGVMDIVATMAELNSGMAIALISIVNFIAALDAGRRSI